MATFPRIDGDLRRFKCNVKRLLAALAAVAMLSGAAGLALAQQPPAKPAPSMPGGDQRSMVQMHAEMMQKMGEIAVKYAERIREDKPSAPR